MELYQEILEGMIKQEIDLVNATSYKALKEIKTIIENDTLSDFECIEEIVCVFERLGSNGGNRHDFG
ncbi:MAG: hypothetical protein FWE69_08255 [Clostridiales bacterium]|nr:hypothetical protein [Clostridiales bacterium]